MNRDIVIESIGAHIDELSGITGWIIPIALVVLVSIWQKKEEIEILSIKITGREATLFIDILVLLFSSSFLLTILRIKALFLQLSAPEDILKAYTYIASDAWVLNPFSYFRYEWTPLSHLSSIFLMLLYIFCVDMSSILLDFSNDTSKNSPSLDIWISSINFIFGWIILFQISHVVFYVGNSLSKVDKYSDVAIGIKAAASDWWFVVLFSFVAGILIEYKIYQRLTAKRKQSDKS